MDNRSVQTTSIALLCALMLAAATLLPFAPASQAQEGGSVHIAPGGGVMASANYAVQGTLAQATAGDAQSANYGVRGGYWGPKGTYRVYLPLIVRSAW